MTASRAVALDHVVIAVSDLDVATRFYGDVVGADVVPIGPGRAAFRIGRAQLTAHSPDFEASDTPAQPGQADICFVWEGAIDDAIAHLRQHEVAVETGPVERPGAKGRGTSVYFRDPDGSLLEFISYE